MRQQLGSLALLVGLLTLAPGVALAVLPTCSYLTPHWFPTGSAAAPATLTGTNFTSDAVVRMTYSNGGSSNDLANTAYSSTTLTVTVPAADFVTQGQNTAYARQLSGNCSTSVYYWVGSETLTSATPSYVMPLAGNTTITVTGTGFTGTSTMRWSPIPLNVFTAGSWSTLATTVVNSTTLTATIMAASLGTAGTAYLQVKDGTNYSDVLPFYVGNPPPTLVSLAPGSGTRGQTLDVLLTGTNFIQGTSSVSFSATGITVNSATVNSATTLTANITIALTTPTGAGNVTVTNATPGGGSATVTGGYTVLDLPNVILWLDDEAP